MSKQLPDAWQWTYELTFAEMFGGHRTEHTTSSEPVQADSERVPFPGVAKKPLEGFLYQAAITSEPRPGSIWEAMVYDGVGPADRSGDRRSGIVLFDGDKSIGSYTDPGFGEPIEWMLYLDPAYRGRGLGQALFIAWWLEFPRHRDLHPRLAMNQYAASSIKAAFARYIELCVHKDFATAVGD
jgi:GNAT superfamily N-acetyltransferase